MTGCIVFSFKSSINWNVICFYPAWQFLCFKTPTFTSYGTLLAKVSTFNSGCKQQWTWAILTALCNIYLLDIINVILMLLVTVGVSHACILMIHLPLHKHNTQDKHTQRWMMALFTPCAIKILMRFLFSEEIAPYQWDLTLTLMAHLLSH